MLRRPTLQEWIHWLKTTEDVEEIKEDECKQK